MAKATKNLSVQLYTWLQNFNLMIFKIIF